MRLRIAILLLAGSSCFGVPHALHGQDRSDEAGVEENTVVSAIEEAETARLLAAEAGAEWLQTASLIREAREAFEHGDWQQALSLADKAGRQGQLAVEQAARESVAWRDRVLR